MPRPKPDALVAVRGPAGPADARTPLQRWRSRRDLVIALAARQGASHRLLGDVFDLPHSRIYAILKRWSERYAPPRP